MKPWCLGFALVVTFILLGELTIVFKGYVYNCLGLNRNVLLMLLWLIPVIASFLVVYLSKKRGVLKGLSLIPVLSLLGSLIHYLFGQFGAVIDFPGLTGLRVTFQLYFVLSVLTIGLGSIVGILIKNKKP